VSGGCKCRAIFVQRNLEIEANVVVSECKSTTAYLLIKFYVIFTFYFGEGCFLTQNAPLVTVVSSNMAMEALRVAAQCAAGVQFR